MIRQELDDLMQKRMDRKDFIKHVALGVFMMTGLAGFLKMTSQQSSQSMGYGSSAYGGGKPKI